jgi:hypothetical protein
MNCSLVRRRSEQQRAAQRRSVLHANAHDQHLPSTLSRQSLPIDHVRVHEITAETTTKKEPAVEMDTQKSATDTQSRRKTRMILTLIDAMKTEIRDDA